MRWSDIPFHPPVRSLRQFAALWALLSAVLPFWYGLPTESWALTLAVGGLGAAVGLLGIVKPGAVRPLFVGAMVLTFPIGWVVSRILLALVYFTVVTPTGLVLRLLGRDALRLRKPENLESYWVPKPAPSGVGSYFNQF